MAWATQWATSIAQHFFLGAAQGRPHGGNLRHHIDAVAILLHHARDAAHLALDANQAFQHMVFGG